MPSIIERIDGVVFSIEDIDPIEIEEINNRAIALMMQGQTEEALNRFFTALNKSGSDQNMRAACLANIGDWVRRVEGDADTAFEIFQRAKKLKITEVTQSRIKSMQAMVFMLPVETGGQLILLDITKAIECFYEAMTLARAAYKDGKEASLRAESFALHRLSGVILRYGSTEQKKQTTTMIFDFLPKLSPDDAEVARFNYALATLVIEINPQEAARMLLESGMRMVEESPLDACNYFARAAKCYCQLGLVTVAKQCLKQAESLEETLDKHINSMSTKKLLQEMRGLLSKIDQN